MKYKLLLLLFLVPVSFVSRAQKTDSIPSSKLVFSLPVFDLPYQFDAAKTVGNHLNVGSFFKGYSNPGMHQSLELSADLYTAAHYGIYKLFQSNPGTKQTRGKRFLYALTICSSDIILMYAPGFDGWEHEEYHRAVMSRFHVNSFNDMNKFPIGAELINVSHVTDEDLIRFKQESPADFNRMQVAGIEGEYLLIDRLQRNNFFYNQHLPHEVFYGFTTLNSIMYVQTCSDPREADPMTDKENAKENTIAVRDFTGLDFLGWTRDLFRPSEPYTARGIHPSGIGINRYTKTTDLTSEELSYLKKQGVLQWLNVISPMMIGIQSIKLSDKGWYGNFSVRDYLTSFGNDISCNVFLMNPKYKFVFAYHSYQNYNRSYPGIEAQLIDYERKIFSTSISVSPRVLVGWQPLHQEFKTDNAAFLGLAECKLEFKTKGFLHPFTELSVKTKGWIAGNEFLNNNFSCRLGVVCEFKK